MEKFSRDDIKSIVQQLLDGRPVIALNWPRDTYLVVGKIDRRDALMPQFQISIAAGAEKGFEYIYNLLESIGKVRNIYYSITYSKPKNHDRNFMFKLHLGDEREEMESIKLFEDDENGK